MKTVDKLSNVLRTEGDLAFQCRLIIVIIHWSVKSLTLNKPTTRNWQLYPSTIKSEAQVLQKKLSKHFVCVCNDE